MRMILSNLKMIGSILAPLSIVCALFGGWFLVVPVFALLFFSYYFIWVYNHGTKLADAHYWTVPKELVDRLMPEFEASMKARGYGKENYVPEVNDCDDYAVAGIVVMHGLLTRERLKYPQSIGKADPLFPFSFPRDDGPRHRLFFVNTDEGRIYIDSWRIGGSMYRTLSIKEESNGEVV